MSTFPILQTLPSFRVPSEIALLGPWWCRKHIRISFPFPRSGTSAFYRTRWRREHPYRSWSQPGGPRRGGAKATCACRGNVSLPLPHSPPCRASPTDTLTATRPAEAALPILLSRTDQRSSTSCTMSASSSRPDVEARATFAPVLHRVTLAPELLQRRNMASRRSLTRSRIPTTTLNLPEPPMKAPLTPISSRKDLLNVLTLNPNFITFSRLSYWKGFTSFMLQYSRFSSNCSLLLNNVKSIHSALPCKLGTQSYGACSFEWSRHGVYPNS